MELLRRNVSHGAVPRYAGEHGGMPGRRVVSGRIVSLSVAVLSLLAFCAWGGFLLSKGIIAREMRTLVESRLANDLGVRIKIGEVNVESPRKIAFDKVQVMSATDGGYAPGREIASGARDIEVPLVAADRVLLNVNPMRFLLQRGDAVGALTSVQFIRPRLFVTRGAIRTWQLTRLFSSQGGRPSMPPGLQLAVFVKDAEVLVRDEWGNDTGSGATGINGSISFGRFPRIRFDLGGRVRMPGGGGFSVEGWVDADTGHVNISGTGNGVRLSHGFLEGVALAKSANTGENASSKSVVTSSYKGKFKINKGSLNLPGTKPDGKPGDAPILGGVKLEKLTGSLSGEVEISGKLGESLSFAGKVYLTGGDFKLTRAGGERAGAGGLDEALSALNSATGKVEGEVEFQGRAPQKAIDALVSSAGSGADLSGVLEALKVPGVAYTYKGNVKVGDGRISLGKLANVCEKLEAAFEGNMGFSKEEGRKPQYNGQMKIHNGSVQLAGIGVGSAMSGVSGDLTFSGEGGRLDYSGKLIMPGSPVKLDKLFPGLEGLEGEIDGEIDIKGSFGGEEPLVQGKAAFGSLPLGEFSLRDVGFNFLCSSGLVSIRDFKARAFGGAISLSGVTGRDIAGALGEIAVSDIRMGELAGLRRFLGKDAAGILANIGGDNGRLNGKLFLKRSEGALDAASRVEMNSFSFMSYPIDSASCNLQFSGGDLLITDLLVKGLGAQLSGFGKITSGGRLDLDLVAQDVPVARFLGTCVPAGAGKPPLTGLLRFVGGLGGTIKEPVLSGFVDIRNGALELGPLGLGERTFRLLRSNITLAGDQINVDGFELYSDDGVYHASGKIAFGTKPLRVDLQVSSTGASLEGILALAGISQEVHGEADMNLRLSGRLDRLWAKGDLTLGQGEAFGVSIGPGRVAFSAESGDIKLESANLTVAGGRLHASGMVLPAKRELDLNVDAAGINLAGLRPALAGSDFRLGGRVDFGGRVGGDIRHPELDGRIAGLGITINDTAFGRAEGQMRWKDGTLSFDRLILTEAGNGSGTLSLTGDINFAQGSLAALKVRTADCLLSTLVGLGGFEGAARMGGRVCGDIEIEGKLSNPSVVAEASISDFALNGVTLGSVVLDVVTSGPEVTVRRAVLSAGEGSVSLSGSIGSGGTLSLVGSSKDFDVASLGRALGSQYRISGLLSFDAKLGGTLAAPKGEFRARVVKGGAEKFSFDELDGTFTLEPDKILIKDMRLTQGTYILSMRGAVPIPVRYLGAMGFRVSQASRGSWDLWLDAVKADLTFLNSFGNWIDWAEGKADVNLHIVGEETSPRVFGYLVINGADVKFVGLADAITDIRGRVAFTGDKAQVEALSGKIRSGSISVSGPVEFKEFRDPVLALNAEARDLPILSDKLTGQLNGNLSITGPVSFPKLAGRLRLDHAEVPFAAVGALGGSSYNAKLDLTIVAGEDVRVKGSGLDVEALGELQVRGTLAAPVAIGVLEARRGQFSYLGTGFEVMRGRAEFSSERGLAPEVDLACETLVKDVRVMLTLNGLLDGKEKLSVTLSSNPPLPQDQILSLLNYPSALSKLLAGNVEGALASEVSRMVDQELRSRLSLGLERLLKGALALDEFKVERGQQEELTVRLGKYLLKNFYLTYSRVLEYEPRDIIKLDYYCSPNMVLSGRFDEDKGYSAGIEVRFGF